MIVEDICFLYINFNWFEKLLAKFLLQRQQSDKPYHLKLIQRKEINLWWCGYCNIPWHTRQPIRDLMENNFIEDKKNRPKHKVHQAITDQKEENAITTSKIKAS